MSAAKPRTSLSRVGDAAKGTGKTLRKATTSLPGSAAKATKFGVGTVLTATKKTSNVVTNVGLSATTTVAKRTVGVSKFVAGGGTAINSFVRATKRRFRQKDITHAWPSRLTSPSMKIDLYIECRNLPRKDSFAKADSFCVVWEVPPGYLGVRTRLGRQYRHPTRQETELDRTKVVKGSCNPVFEQTFRVNFRFESEQTYCIRVYDQDHSFETDVKEHDYLGGAILSMGRLMGAPGRTILTPLEDGDGAQLIVRGEETVETRESLESRFSAELNSNKDKVLESMDPFFKFEKLDHDTQTWTTVWKSEVIQNSPKPTWAPIRLPVLLLCDDEPDIKVKDLKISLWNLHRGEKEELVGGIETNVLSLAKDSLEGIQVLRISKEKKRGFRGVLTYAEKRKAGILKVLKADVIEVPSFLSYISGGCRMDLVVAVDFSSNNGDHLLEDSLHYRRDNWLNDYQVAIHKLGIIMEPYTHKKQYTMWGFGATQDGVQKPYIELGKGQISAGSSESMLNAYERACDNPFVEPSDEPRVTELIQAAAYRSITKATRDEQRYSVLCILTAGSLSERDMQESLDTICTASEDAPLSIVVIGVGSGDFTAISVLCGGQGELRHSNGVPISRDVVSFVAFRDFDNNPSRVVAEALSQIPEQLVGYFHDNGIKPRPPVPAPDPDEHYAAYMRKKERTFHRRLHTAPDVMMSSPTNGSGGGGGIMETPTTNARQQVITLS